MIEFADFQKVEMKTGKVLAVEVHPNADKLYVVRVDLGAGETRTVVAGVRAWYAPEQLVGKTVIVAANLQPRALRGVESQGMLLAVHDGDRVKVLTVDGEAAPGIRETFSARVIGDLGQFGGLFHLGAPPGYRDPVLVSTIDGVGTKALVARAAGRLEVAGQDVIIHGVNDVAVLGATPLFALDYLAAARLDAAEISALLAGAAAACREEGIALL